MIDLWPLMMLALLGLLHGINPIMGWFFAVVRAFQEGQRAVVYRSLIPLALGHAAAIAAMVLAAVITGVVVESLALELGAAGVLLAFGGYRLWRVRRQPGRASLRASASDLAVWSFLAATAYGEGEVVVPRIMVLPIAEGVKGLQEMEPLAIAAALAWILVAIAVHTLAMAVAAGAVAIFLFDRLKLGSVRRAKINLDRVWAVALVTTAAVFLFIGLVAD